jgi:epoxyqueuosine reductase
MEKLFAQLTEQGYRGRIVPVQILDDLQEEFEGHSRRGLLDQELYQAYLAGFTFSPPDSMPGARSLIVVAVPQPQIQVTFTWEGEPVRYMIPPTYPERRTDDRIQELLSQLLQPAGYRVIEAVVPRKLLAVRSGLAAYGKNNISYVPGMGSFHGLVVLYSDLPAPQSDWRARQMMPTCQNCSACLHHCPAGAISSERFLLHAERCLTFHNEKPGSVPFAAWIDPSWHNCLVGCLHCQRVCPENKAFWRWVEEGADFSQQETALLLEGTPAEQLPVATIEKMHRVGLDGYYDVLPRNLNALLHQRR